MIVRALVFVVALVAALGVYNAAHANHQGFNAALYCVDEADTITLMEALMNDPAEAGRLVAKDKEFKCYWVDNPGVGPIFQGNIFSWFETEDQGKSCVIEGVYMGSSQKDFGRTVWAFAQERECIEVTDQKGA